MKRSALLALAIPLIALSLPALVLPRALAQVTNSNYQTSYTGDGVTTVYSFNWRLIDPTQMFVQVNGSTVSPSTYTVFQNSNGIGGTVTFTTAPPIGQTILIQRNSDYLQQTTLLNNAALPPATLQEMIDKLTIECQQLSLNSSSGGGAGTVTSLIASGANWPTWLIPSVATATTTPNLSVNAGTMSGDAVSINQSGVATLAQPLHNLVGYNSTGIIVQTALNTFASRALSSPNGTLSLGNINGASGNPTLDLPVQGRAYSWRLYKHKRNC